MRHWRHQMGPVEEEFQSSSDPKAGCDVGPRAFLLQFRCFNPHPTRRPDATVMTSVLGRWVAMTRCFNPHPTRRPDATLLFILDEGDAVPVSILIRPEGRMRRYEIVEASWETWFQSSSDPKAGCDVHRQPQLLRLHLVSILIRPEGRMRPFYHPAVGRLMRGFQSSSDPKAGCDAIADQFGVIVDVSILIRPEGRMRHLASLEI